MGKVRVGKIMCGAELCCTGKEIKCRLLSRSCGKHLLRVVPHEGVGLNMQVSKHFVRSPSADESDDVGVHLGKEKCRCTRCSETSCRYFVWKKTQCGPQFGHSVADAGGNGIRCDEARGVVDMSERCCRTGPIVTKV